MQNAWLQQGRDAAADVFLDDSCGGVLPAPVAARTSSACKAVLRGLLRADPAARWTHQEFFNAPWLTEPAPANAPCAASSAAFTGGGSAIRVGSSAVPLPLSAPLLQHAPPDPTDSWALARSASVATAVIAQSSATPLASVKVSFAGSAVEGKGDSEATLFGVTVIEDDEGGVVQSQHVLPPANAAPSLDDTSGSAEHAEIQHGLERHGGGGGWAEAARYPLALLADTAVRGLRVGTHFAGSAQSYVRRYVVPELESYPVPPAVLPTALGAMDVARSTALAPVSSDLLNQMLGAVLPRQALSRQSPWALALACHIERSSLPATLADLDAALEKAEAMRRSAGSQQASPCNALDCASSLTWAVWAARPAEHPAIASAIPAYVTGPTIDAEGASPALAHAKPPDIGSAMPAALPMVEHEQPGDPWVLV